MWRIVFVCVYLLMCARECKWERRVWEDEGKLRDIEGQEQTEIDKIFPCDPPPQSSDYICAITLSQHGLSAGSSHLPEPPQCIPPPAVVLLLFLVPLLFLLTTMLSDHSSYPLTLALTCLGLGVIIGPLPGGGKMERKAGEKKKGIVWKTTALLPLVPIPGAQL